MGLGRLQTQTEIQGPETLSSQFQHKRFQHIAGLVEDIGERIGQPVRIIDLGGTPDYWELRGVGGDPNYDITVLNLTKPAVAHPNIRSVLGDATAADDYPDQHFDLVVSNSVIEHVGSISQRIAMAREVARLAPAYYVQTPHKWFPRRSASTPEHRAGEPEGLHLLDTEQFRRLFPGSEIHKDRFFGLAKSLIAIRRDKLPSLNVDKYRDTTVEDFRFL